MIESDRGWSCVVEASTCELRHRHIHAIFRIIALVIGPTTGEVTAIDSRLRKAAIIRPDPVSQSVRLARAGLLMPIKGTSQYISRV